MLYITAGVLSPSAAPVLAIQRGYIHIGIMSQIFMYRGLKFIKLEIRLHMILCLNKGINSGNWTVIPAKIQLATGTWV